MPPYLRSDKSCGLGAVLGGTVPCNSVIKLTINELHAAIVWHAVIWRGVVEFNPDALGQVQQLKGVFFLGAGCASVAAVPIGVPVIVGAIKAGAAVDEVAQCVDVGLIVHFISPVVARDWAVLR